MTINVFFSITVDNIIIFITTMQTRVGAESYFLPKGELVGIPPICSTVVT